MQLLKEKCPDCGQGFEFRAGQAYHDGWLFWKLIAQCQRCDTRIELSSRGPTPEALRDLIMADSGVYGLRVSEQPDEQLLILLKTIRAILGISLRETVRLKEHLPGIVYYGTQLETWDWACQLQDAGFAATTIRAESGAEPGSAQAD